MGLQTSPSLTPQCIITELCTTSNFGFTIVIHVFNTPVLFPPIPFLTGTKSFLEIGSNAFSKSINATYNLRFLANCF